MHQKRRVKSVTTESEDGVQAQKSTVYPNAPVGALLVGDAGIPGEHDSREPLIAVAQNHSPVFTHGSALSPASS